MAPLLTRSDEPSFEPEPPAIHTVFVTGLAITAGALAAAYVLPTWLPGLSESLLGPEPKAYWYLARASGLVAFALLWLSMLWGLLMTSRVARRWPGAVPANDLHQHVSLLALGLALFHALILLGDRYADYRLSQLLIPFAGGAYRPLWVGFGQLGFYLSAIVALSFYVRRWLGNRAWRAVHMLSFAVYFGVLAHGVMAGTDASLPWIQASYVISAASVLFLTLYRLLVAWFSPAPAVRRPSGT